MIKKTMYTLFALVLAAATLFLAGCTAQGTPTPTTDPAAVYTQVAQTVAQTVQAQVTNNAKLTPATNTPPKPTETQAPSATLRASSTPLALGSVTPTSLTKTITVTGTQPTKALATTAVVLTLPAATQPAATSPDKMQYIGQSIADGATFSPLQTFTITWTLQNIGTTTWDNTYLVRLFAGPSLGATDGSIGQTVKPQGQAKISLDMRAPDKTGDYNIIWVLTAPDGHNFGSFTLNFKVK